MAQEWDIKPRSTACSACQAAFADKQPYYSALTFADKGYTRADYCSPCWTSAGSASGAYSAWQGIFRLPPPEPEQPLRRENAEALLRRLIAEEPEARRNVIFILMVMLERTRIMAERDVQTRDDGGLVRIYEHKKTGETFVIADPGLRLEQLEQVEMEVMELLGVDVNRGKSGTAESSTDKNTPAATDAVSPGLDSGVPSGDNA
jgi:hypothetical protein